MRSAVLLVLIYLLGQNGNSQNLIPYRYNYKYGFANEAGKIIIEPNYDKVDWFDEKGYARVELEGLWGIIDKNGNHIVEPLYTQVFNFKEGLAPFCEGGEYAWLQGEIVGGKWGFLNEKGEAVIPAKFHRAENFYNGYAIVQIEGDNWGNWGVIDKTGKQILPYKYATYSFDMRPFPGIRWDEKEKGKLWYRKGQWDETWIQIDLKGIPTGKKLESIHGDYASDNSPLTIEKNGKYALKSRDGKMLTGYDYDYGIYFYNDEKVAVIVKSNKYGIIDLNGKVIVEPQYEQINIAGNYLIVKVENKYAITTLKGAPINGSETIWNDYQIEFVGENLFAIKTENGSHLINAWGESIGSDYYNVIYELKDGMIKVLKDNKYGFIDKNGKQIIECKYPYADNFENGYAKVDLNINQYKIPDEGYINKNGIEFFKGTLPNQLVKSNTGKYQITDQYGNFTETNYQNIYELDNDYFVSYDNDITSIINSSGELVLFGNFSAIIPSCVETDPDLNDGPLCYYAAKRSDSVFIYNRFFEKSMAISGTWTTMDDQLFTRLQYVIDRGKGEIIRNNTGEIISKRFQKIYYYPEKEIFLAEGKNDSTAILSSNGSILSQYKKQHILPIDGAYISFTGVGKNRTAELFNLNGEKLNKIPANNIYQGYNVYGLYFIDNDKTKKHGYYWNGILKEAEYDDILTFHFGTIPYVITKKENKLSIYNSQGKKMFDYDFEYFHSNNSCAVVKKDGKYGIITIQDDEPVVLISFNYDEIPGLTDFPEFIPVKTGNKYVYINQKEEIVIDKNFSDAEPFSDGQAFVKIDNKTGVISDYNEWVIEPKYKNMDFWYGMDQSKVYTAHTFENKKMLFNSEGKNILPAGIDSLNFEIFEDGYFIAAFNNKMAGTIDFLGNTIVEPKYKSISSYLIEKEDTLIYYFIAQTETGYGLLDRNGKEISLMNYNRPYNTDENYIAAELNLIPVSRKGKYGALNISGKEVITCNNERIEWFDEGNELKVIRMKSNGKWGLFTSEGKIITTPQYEQLFINWDITDHFSDTSNSIYFESKKDGKIGLINQNGKEIYPNIYSEISVSYDCMDGHALELKSGKLKGIGMIKGKVLLEPQFNSISCNMFNDALYFVVNSGKKYQIIRQDGSAVNNHLYEMIDWMGYDYLAGAKRNGTWFYVHPDGQETKMDE